MPLRVRIRIGEFGKLLRRRDGAATLLETTAGALWCSSRIEQPSQQWRKLRDGRLTDHPNQRRDDAVRRCGSAKYRREQRDLESSEPNTALGSELGQRVNDLDSAAPGLRDDVVGPALQLRDNRTEIRGPSSRPTSLGPPIELEESIAGIARWHEHQRNEQSVRIGRSGATTSPAQGGNSPMCRHEISASF